MLGHLGPDELSVEEVNRFPNDPVSTPDGLHWSILELYRNVLVGLRKAVSAQPDLRASALTPGPSTMVW